MSTGRLYALVFSNGKAYIGQTKRSVRARLNDHRFDAKRNFALPVYHAWRKYGEPECIHLGEFPVSELDAREIKYIASFNTLGPVRV